MHARGSNLTPTLVFVQCLDIYKMFTNILELFILLFNKHYLIDYSSPYLYISLPGVV